MFLNFILIGLLNCFALIQSVPVNQTFSMLVCNSSKFKYYQEHPNNPRIYYQCDPWGNSTEHECLNETVWNDWLVKCDNIGNMRNLTLNVAFKPKDFDCTLENNGCLNHGECNQERKCKCLPQFTGENCESEVQSIVEDILSQNFNLTNLKEELIQSYKLVNASYYEKYNNLLENDTYSKLNDYLDMYKDNIRLDVLINNLVEKILKEIYPDTEFLAFFMANDQPIGYLLRLMPSILSYSRYSANRFEYVFEHFKSVLRLLIDNLKLNESNLDQKAKAYKHLILHFLNQTITLSNGTNNLANRTIETMSLDENNLIEYLRFNFELIVDSSEQLFIMLENFHFNLINQFGFSNSSIYDINLEKLDYDQTERVFDFFTDIKAASERVWDTLNNFGFWFIINFFSNI